jgi:hypothetical protein
VPDGEEGDNYKHLTAEMCWIYSQTPRELTVMDRVRITKTHRDKALQART